MQGVEIQIVTIVLYCFIIYTIPTAKFPPYYLLNDIFRNVPQLYRGNIFPEDVLTSYVYLCVRDWKGLVPTGISYNHAINCCFRKYKAERST